jgi:hypothetical protein
MKLTVGIGALILVAIAIAAWQFRTTRRDAAALPDDRDGQTLAQLVKAGSDLSKPHNLEFFLYFPEQHVAEATAQQLMQLGFQAKVTPAANGPEWLCLATRTVVPSHKLLLEISAQMDALAHSGGGEYDGWGSEVTR